MFESTFVELPSVLVVITNLIKFRLKLSLNLYLRLPLSRADGLLLHKLEALHHLILIRHVLVWVVPLVLIVDIHCHVDWLVNLVLLRLIWGSWAK